MSQDRLVPIAQARETLGGVSRTLFYRLVAAKKIRIVKLGRRSMVPASDLARIIGGDDAPEESAS